MSKWIAAVLLLLAAPVFAARFPKDSPVTTNNDDSCDIGIYPAATLLLPYFEVSLGPDPAPGATTTLFTVTNVSRNAQVAQVTLWTDYAYPALSFSVFLTGYDVQSINLYDVLGRGQLPATSAFSARGELSGPNDGSPALARTVTTACAGTPSVLPASLLAEVRTLFTHGTLAACGTTHVGYEHVKAIGYATIDTVATCTAVLPTDPSYFANAITYDNVLTGDYQQLDAVKGSANPARGNSMVHIRAIPERGSVTNLPHTFYDRLLPAGQEHTDRRQPLPSVFAAHLIDSWSTLDTDVKIWRDADTPVPVTCVTYQKNRSITVDEVIRFDEHENATSLGYFDVGMMNMAYFRPTSNTSIRDGYFPPKIGDDAGGWLYLNLSGELATDPPIAHDGPRQSWVIVSMSAAGGFSVDIPATAFGNGCSPAAPLSGATSRTGPPIGPLPDENP